METLEIRNTLFSYISRAHHRGASYIDVLLREKGIKDLAYSHVRIIIILSVYKRLSMKEISELISKDKSTVTSLVNKLEKIGYVRKVACITAKGGFYMELAKVTSKGQVTIPIEIRKKLGIKNGDKILFVEESGRIYMMNSSMDALREAQRAFAGEAERLGLKDDDDVMTMIKELREESVVK